MSKASPNRRQVKQSETSLLLLISLPLSCVTPFSLVMPPPHPHVCMCVCSHAPSRIMSMLMLMLLMLSTLGCQPPTAPSVHLCVALLSLPRAPPAVCCYLESQHTHTLSHTLLCTGVFLDSPLGCVVCVVVCRIFVFFIVFYVSGLCCIEMVKSCTEKTHNKQKG